MADGYGAVFPGLGRSREGAWIEIINYQRPYVNLTVAPVRERGLK